MDTIHDNDATAHGAHPCRRCAQTGQFITGTVNGKPRGPGGPCYRCNGKGYHDRADRKRNDFRDRRALLEALRDMVSA